MSKNEIIEDKPLTEALSERYISYALSTIMGRSLPDVRDGLKPVHRRLLYAMLELKLDPKNGFKKCARVVGDVIGKYHPHGDAAVYETLVRLAQDFSVRYPLINGQGNFGSIDGDNAAAMRYTESKLTEIAMSLLEDIKKDTVDFRPTYDGLEEEPILLPASFPNLLANGSEGIAVGMATSIPPHNLDELCNCLIKIIEKPSITIEELIEIMPGPDFPTGGIIVEQKESITNTYKTGRGSFRLRAKWHKEDFSMGLYQIVITEIPYQVQKSKLIEKIAELYRDKKLVLLGNFRDESDENIRIILEPRSRSVDAETLMETLFKFTDLEIRFNMNMNVIDSGHLPRVMNIKEVLEAFISHRSQVILRRSRFRLGQIKDRLEILDGLIICYLNIDEVIRIIREEDEPKTILMKKFKLSEVQAESILNLRLRSLRKLEEIEIKKEQKELLEEQSNLTEIVENEARLKKVIIQELKNVQKQFGYNTALGKRRTDFGEAKELGKVISLESLVEKEPITIFCSKMGWIKSIKGHGNYTIEDTKYKEGDEGRFILQATTLDKLIIFTSSGKFFTILCDKISRGKGFGDPIRLMVELGNDDIIDMFILKPESKFLLTSANGKGFVVNAEDVVAQTKSGKQILNLQENDCAYICKEINGDMIAIIGNNRKLLIFDISEIPNMKRGSGVQLQKYKDAKLSDISIFNKNEGLSWQTSSNVKCEKNIIPWLGKRGGVGKLPPSGFLRNNKFFD